jgi:hypothetical protein
MPGTVAGNWASALDERLQAIVMARGHDPGALELIRATRLLRQEVDTLLSGGPVTS